MVRRPVEQCATPVQAAHLRAEVHRTGACLCRVDADGRTLRGQGLSLC